MVEKTENGTDYGNEIIIADKEPERYCYALLKSLQPENYDKYNEIKIQTIEANLPRTEYVLGLFTSLWVEIEDRQKKKLKITKPNGESYSIEVIEITLVKHPKLRR